MTADDLYARRLRERFEAPVIDVDPDVLIRRGRSRRAGRWATAGVAVAVACVAAGLLLPGRDGGALTADGPPPEPDGAEAAFWLSADRVPAGADLAVVMVSRGGSPLIGGVGVSVERWDGTAWRAYGFASLCTDFWQCRSTITSQDEGHADIGIVVPAVGIGTSTAGVSSALSLSTEGLAPGWYRISQDLLDESESPAPVDARRHVPATGQFEVAADAPEPAPLWDLDGAAISVTPPILPPAGGDLLLSPVVPPDPDGNQTLEDIQAAVDGLSLTARIERWEGGAWVAVGEATLAPDEVYTDGLTMSTALGALDPGAYRLVRSGPQGEHAGSFWVADLGLSPAEPTGAPTAASDFGWPAGSPGLTVDPATVSPAGGQVTLVPIAVEGLADDDLAQALSRLLAPALLERRDGDAWVALGEVPLFVPDDELTPTTAEVPPHPTGEYRLVRSGPDGDAWGTFTIAEPVPVHLTDLGGDPEQAKEERRAFETRLTESRADPGAPAEFRDRAPYASCGVVFVGQGAYGQQTAEPALCLENGQAFGAELVTLRVTVEGGLIVTYERWGSGGHESFVDSTDDAFGSQDWSHEIL
jgi:hypothetical protein